MGRGFARVAGRVVVAALSLLVLKQLHAGNSGDGGDSTDVMIVVHIPAGARGATAISIPRDSYVRIADGFGQHKINSAYAYAKNAAVRRLREQELGGAELDRAAAQAGARTLINTVGALTHRMLSTNILTDPDALDRLTAALRASLTVDEGFDVLVLARQLQRVSAGQVSFTTIPTGSLAMRTPDGTAVEVDPDQVRAFVAQLEADTAPPSPTPALVSVSASEQSCTN